MSYTKLFLLGVGLSLFNIVWWKATIFVVLFIVVSAVEKLARERRLKKILDDEFDTSWKTYEFDSTIEIKDELARLKIEGDQNKAMLSRLARLMYRVACNN
jgi:hypothetical protein